METPEEQNPEDASVDGTNNPTNEDVKDEDTPAPITPPIRGILKLSSGTNTNSTKANSIRWDEDKISQMETQRGTRRKIDEPKTPYVQPFDYENIDEDERAEITNDSDGCENCEFSSDSESDNESVQGEEDNDDDWDDSDDTFSEKLAKGASKEITTTKFEMKRSEHYKFDKKLLRNVSNDSG